MIINRNKKSISISIFETSRSSFELFSSGHLYHHPTSLRKQALPQLSETRPVVQAKQNLRIIFTTKHCQKTTGLEKNLCHLWLDASIECKKWGYGIQNLDCYWSKQQIGLWSRVWSGFRMKVNNRKWTKRKKLTEITRPLGNPLLVFKKQDRTYLMNVNHFRKSS